MAFDNIKLIDFENDSGPLEFAVLAPDNDWWRIFEEGFDAWILGRSRSTNEG